MRRKNIHKGNITAGGAREPAIEEPPREVTRVLRRWKRTIGHIAAGLFPNRKHGAMIAKLCENVGQLGNRDALMVVAKFGDEEAAAQAISRLDIGMIKEIAQIPVPDDYRPGFRLAREKLGRECQDDFEAQCVLAANGWEGSLERIRQLMPKTDPAEVFLSFARHHTDFERICPELLSASLDNVIPIMMDGKHGKSELIANLLGEIVIVGMARESMLSRLALEALSRVPHLVDDERTALALAIHYKNEDIGKAMLAKLGHMMLAEAYERGIHGAAECLEQDFDNVHDEKALACIVRASESLRARAVERLGVDSLGALLDYPEARRKALSGLEKIGSAFSVEMSGRGGCESFAVEAGRVLGDIRNVHVLKIIYRNHPEAGVSRRALSKLEGLVEKADDQTRRDILRISFNRKARAKAVRGLDDVHELIYHFSESDDVGITGAALERFGELVREDCDEPLSVAGIVIRHSGDAEALAAALGRLLGILSGDDEGMLAPGTEYYHDDVPPNAALDILAMMAGDIIRALSKIERNDLFMAAVLSEKLRLTLSDCLEEYPSKRTMGGIMALAEHILEKQTPLN